MYKQLEIYWVNLDPTIGAETKKKRPCVILQSNTVNKYSKTVIVAPLLPGHKEWPFVINLLPSKKNKLDKQRHINLKQLRAVDVARIANLHGMLEGNYKAAINAVLQIVFDLC